LPPNISFIDSRRLLQILATSFSPKTRAKMRERREMGEMGERGEIWA